MSARPGEETDSLTSPRSKSPIMGVSGLSREAGKPTGTQPQHTELERRTSGSILRLDPSKSRRRSSAASVEYRHQEDPSSPCPSDRLSVTWADVDKSVSSDISYGRMRPEMISGNPSMITLLPGSHQRTPQPTNKMFLGDSDHDDDLDASVSVILRKASSKKSVKRKKRQRGRTMSIFTTSSGDTAIDLDSENDEDKVQTYKEVILGIKHQPWTMDRKLQLTHTAKEYLKKHEGELEDRLASGSKKDILYGHFIKFRRIVRTTALDFYNWFKSVEVWQGRIKNIESHFGSAVASYFTFLRWLIFLNGVIAIALISFVLIPEILASEKSGTGERKIILEDDRDSAYNLKQIWQFEGFLKPSAIFYGFYSKIKTTAAGYRIPLAYIVTAMVVYGYSFVGVLRKMTANSRMSKMGDDEVTTFTFRLFAGWDYTIGNTEAAQNKVAAINMGFRESLLEAREAEKEEKSWKLTAKRVLLHFLVACLLMGSSYAVYLLVERSNENDESWWRKYELTIGLNLLSFVFPNFFELIGRMENRHPRKQLQWELARIMVLNLLNLYTLIFSLFLKVHERNEELCAMKDMLIEKVLDSGLTTDKPVSTMSMMTTLPILTTILVTRSPTSTTAFTNMSLTSNSEVIGSSNLHEDSCFKIRVKCPPKGTDDPFYDALSKYENDTEMAGGKAVTNSYSPFEYKLNDTFIEFGTNFDSINEVNKTDLPTVFLGASIGNNSAILTPNDTVQSYHSSPRYSRIQDPTFSRNFTVGYQTDKELNDSTNAFQRDEKVTTPLPEIFGKFSDALSNLNPILGGIHFLNYDNSLSKVEKDYPEAKSRRKRETFENDTEEISTSVSDFGSDYLTFSEPFYEENNTSQRNVTENSSSIVEVHSTQATPYGETELMNEIVSHESEVLTSTRPKLDSTTHNPETTESPSVKPVTGVFLNPDDFEDYTIDYGYLDKKCFQTVCNGSRPIYESDNTSFVSYNDANGTSNSTFIDDSSSDAVTVPTTTTYTNGKNVTIIPEDWISEIMNQTERKKLQHLCWETMFGQEITKIILMDLVFTVTSVLLREYVRAVLVRLFNRCWCWDLEKGSPGYPSFAIAENILHIINNQGMVWMGMFFAPGLPAINLIKLVILLYIRSWAVVVSNVPPETVFKASDSNNFYLALLLGMLFLCTLPVGYAVVWIGPSWHCGPFSDYPRIYQLATTAFIQSLPKILHPVIDYISSPGVVIPGTLLLILIIYYFTSVTAMLKEANKDLKDQLRKERYSEKQKALEARQGKRTETPTTRWGKVIQLTPSPSRRSKKPEPILPENANDRTPLLQGEVEMCKSPDQDDLTEHGQSEVFDESISESRRNFREGANTKPDKFLYNLEQGGKEGVIDKEREHSKDSIKSPKSRPRRRRHSQSSSRERDEDSVSRHSISNRNRSHSKERTRRKSSKDSAPRDSPRHQKSSLKYSDSESERTAAGKNSGTFETKRTSKDFSELGNIQEKRRESEKGKRSRRIPMSPDEIGSNMKHKRERPITGMAEVHNADRKNPIKSEPALNSSPLEVEMHTIPMIKISKEDSVERGIREAKLQRQSVTEDDSHPQNEESSVVQATLPETTNLKDEQPEQQTTFLETNFDEEIAPSPNMICENFRYVDDSDTTKTEQEDNDEQVLTQQSPVKSPSMPRYTEHRPPKLILHDDSDQCDF